MRRFTLIGDGVMDFVQIGCEEEAELFEEFFRETYPESGLASYETEAVAKFVRTDEEAERIQDLMLEFGCWRNKQ